MGMDGMDLCVGLFYEHRFAVLTMAIIVQKRFAPVITMIMLAIIAQRRDAP